jgi:hypothetical protein
VTASEETVDYETACGTPFEVAMETSPATATPIS